MTELNEAFELQFDKVKITNNRDYIENIGYFFYKIFRYIYIWIIIFYAWIKSLYMPKYAKDDLIINNNKIIKFDIRENVCVKNTENVKCSFNKFNEEQDEKVHIVYEEMLRKRRYGEKK